MNDNCQVGRFAVATEVVLEGDAVHESLVLVDMTTLEAVGI